ncbi:MAG: outer membrane protein transport protein [Betaproteobacteria bacterium]
MSRTRRYPPVAQCATHATMVAFAATLSGTACAGGLIAYELGTADIGLASAGYGARAQDASTVFTNPAGMTRLDGNQFLGSGQILWGNTKFSKGAGTSSALGSNDGGYAIGHGGWFPGGGAFGSRTVSPDVKVGFATAGNFGGVLNYENDWVGRYYVQQTWMVGLSLLPSVAWKVNDGLSLGASLNAMYGIYKNNVAINNVDPLYGDGRLKLKDERWGWGANLGLLYEMTSATRFGLTWTSQVNLNFNAPAEFTGLAPGVSAALGKAGLLNSSIEVGIKVPQQVMASLFTQVDERWALLGSVGWQQWSKFGQLQLGIDDSTHPKSLTTAIPFKDTWHVAAGAQYRLSEPWLLNFGIAYDSAYQQDSSQISPLLPSNDAWRFGVGGQQQLSKTAFWGVTAEYLSGGTLSTNIQTKPVALGGHGDLVGSYNNTGVLFLGGYYSRTF